MIRGMAAPLKPTIVCFDLGGVLVHICYEWDEACRYAGVDLRVRPSSERIDPRADTIAQMRTRLRAEDLI